MLRWTFALLALSQASPALAQEKCGGRRIERGDMEVIVTVKQQGDEAPLATYISFSVKSSDGKLRTNTAYRKTDDRLIPYSFSINADPALPAGEMSRITTRWQLNGGAWSAPDRRYPDNYGKLFMVIARSSTPALSYRTELLDKLPQGGLLVVNLAVENRAEELTFSLAYPDEKTIAAFYAEARAQAIEKLAPCGPPVFISPAKPTPGGSSFIPVPSAPPAEQKPAKPTIRN